MCTYHIDSLPVLGELPRYGHLTRRRVDGKEGWSRVVPDDLITDGLVGILGEHREYTSLFHHIVDMSRIRIFVNKGFAW